MSSILTDIHIRTREVVRFNVAPEGKYFECDFLAPGIVSYRDHRGGGIELLRKETIDRALPSAIGNPLIDGHTWVTAENRLELEEGLIQEVFFDPADAKYHAKGTVDTDKARALLKVKKPSIGYRVTEPFGPGGVYQGIKYDKEILGIEFNHLAIVDSPRYEESTFRLNHSVSDPSNMNVFKFLRKLVTRENGADGKPGSEVVKTETLEATGDTEIEIELDGKTTPVRLNDLAQVWMKQSKDAVEAGTRLNSEDEVEIDGKQVKVNELVNCYKTHGIRRENTSPAPEAVPTEDEKTDKAQRVNSFLTLRTARDQQTEGAGYSTSSGSLRDRLSRGKERY